MDYGFHNVVESISTEDDDDDDDDGEVDGADVRHQELDRLEGSDWKIKPDMEHEEKHHVPVVAKRNRRYEKYELDCPVQRLRALDPEYLKASQVAY